MKTLAKTLALIALFLVHSCGKSEPVYDGSSAEAAEASIERMTKDMNATEKKEFTAAYAKLAFGQALAGAMGEKQDGEMVDDFMKKLDGKTAVEIVEMASR